MDDLTTFLQGPLHPTGINYCHHYLKYGKVLIVYYDNDPKKHLLDNVPEDVTLVEIPSVKNVRDYFNFNNTYFQTYGIYQSLKQIDTEFCIRTRTDEFFPDMDIFVDNIKLYSEKFHVTNLYSFKDDEHKFCMGNHLFGGKTTYLLKGFRWGMESCKFNQMEQYNCGLINEQQMFLMDKNGFKIKMWSEIFNTICMLFGKDTEIVAEHSKAIMIEHFFLTPLKDFPGFMWTHKYTNHQPITDDHWNSAYNIRFLDKIEDV